jgi:hypothetical protein
MSSVPLPTRIILLPSLRSMPHGTKVRFLGCVSTYQTSSGRLLLQHPPSKMTARVDIAHVDVRAADLAAGAWVNVIGYVQEDVQEDVQPKGSYDVGDGAGERDERALAGEGGEGEDGRKGAKRRLMARESGEAAREEGNGESEVAHVQALMLWSAGAIDLKQYEEGIKGRMKVDQVVARMREKNAAAAAEVQRLPWNFSVQQRAHR